MTARKENRRRTPLILQIAISAYAFFIATIAIAQEGTLIVANRHGGSISLIDLRAGVEIARVPIGPVIPHEIDVSPDGSLAITGEYGENSDPGRHVVVIDVATATVTARIDLGANSRPHTVLFLADGRRAVATMQDSDQLALLDIESQRVLRTYPTGGREGHMVRLSPDGTRAYVTSRGAEGTLSVIYLDEDRAPVVIATGAGAEGIDVTADGTEIWVANRVDATLSIVDAQSLRVVATLPIGPGVGRVEIGTNGLAVMPAGPDPAENPAQQMLQIWDIASRSIVKAIPMRDGNAQYGGFGVHVQGDTLYFADRIAGTIQAIALDESSERTVIATNHERPDGIAWSPVRMNVMDSTQ